MSSVSRWCRRALVLVALGALVAGGTGCGSSSTPTPRAASPTTVPASVEGTEIDQLPTVPAATEDPSWTAPTSQAARQQFLSQVFNDIQQMWSSAFAQAGLTYRPARLVFYTSAVTTACGAASSDAGPFYCSGDQAVYLDTRFFDDMAAQYGVTGDFAQAYVVAHEMGHHVQNLLGITAQVSAAGQADPSAKNALSIRLELQADCFAGVWAHSTYERNLLEPGDLDEALKAAGAVGDDFLQKAATGQVVPEQWTHGTSAQRQHWLTEGYQSGQPSACDTFAATT